MNSLTEKIPVQIVFLTSMKHVSSTCLVYVSKHVSDHIDFNFSLNIENMYQTCLKHVWLEMQAAAPQIHSVQRNMFVTC